MNMPTKGDQAIHHATVSTPQASLGATLRGAHSPIYASPQQKRGHKPDVRDDVHALGVIGFQLLLADLQAERPSGTSWRRKVAACELPDSVLDEWRGLDALYLGAVGTPEVPPGVIERGLLLKMRFELDLFVNRRPFIQQGNLAGHDVDFEVIRETSTRYSSRPRSRAMTPATMVLPVPGLPWNSAVMPREVVTDLSKPQVS